MSVADRIGEFFAAYPLRVYDSEEMHSLLRNLLLPFLSEARSIHGEPISIPPMSIIKMLTIWSKFPSLYHLYALRITWMNRNETLMDLMINPLIWSGLTSSMLRIIRQALWNLLTMADETSAGQLEMNYAVIPIIKDTNYGTSLVVYHIERLVQFLAESIEDKNNNKKVSMENLNILSNHLERKIPKDQMAQNMLNTLARLVKHISHPEEFIRRLGPLFSQIESRNCRESLVSIVLSLSENIKTPTDLCILLKLVADLDSWDKKKVEEPDHEKRHLSYAKLFEVLVLLYMDRLARLRSLHCYVKKFQIWSIDQKIDVNLIIMFVHTHFFTLNKSADISLRSSSSSNLRALIEHVGRVNYENDSKRKLVDSHIIPIVRRGFHCEAEVVREEIVRCLVTLIDNFPSHPQLMHLNQLRNHDCDLDFFANVIHIQVFIITTTKQIHRRQRAIHKLVDNLKDNKVSVLIRVVNIQFSLITFQVFIPFEVLNKFFIPLIHPYLINVTSKNSALSDECLRLLNTILRLASWPKYISCLDHWMNRLNQELEVNQLMNRIIVAIIDAFHFDVAEAEESCKNNDSSTIRIAVRNKIVNHLLPKLSKCINGKASCLAAALGVHKKARTSENKYYNEDDDIQRAPVALATTKLLMKLPPSIMSQHLHGNNSPQKILLALAGKQRDAYVEPAPMLSSESSCGTHFPSSRIFPISCNRLETVALSTPRCSVSSSWVCNGFSSNNHIDLHASVPLLVVGTRREYSVEYAVFGKRFDSSDRENIARLDPFVLLVTRCLALKYDKGFTQIINISDSSFLTKKHISLLLNYVETDLLDSQKQATAFSLVKAIVKKRIAHDRIPEVMKLLSELSITSTISHIRAQCRDTLSDFIGNHPNSDNPKEYLEFFLAQLEYEHVDGQLSAADMLHLLFSNLLQPVLNENCMFCVVKLAACKINSDVPKCKSYVAAALRKLLEEVGEGSRGDVYSAACDWLECDMEGSRAVAVEVLIELSHVEKSRFACRMTSVLSLIGKKLCSDDLLEKNSESTLTALLDGMVLILHNICTAAKDIVRSEDFLKIIGLLGPMAMCRDSSSIRRASSSLIGQFLSLTENTFWSKCTTVPSLVSNLIDWMCWQLRDKKLDIEVAEQASRNIVFLSMILSIEDFCNLLSRLASICKFEIVHQPRNALKRISCFKLSAALAVRENGKKFDAIVDLFLPLFVREMNRKSANNTEELYSLAIEIGDVFKKKLGEQEYGSLLAKCQMESIKKSEDRKRRLKEISVTAPAEAAEMKRKKHMKKVVARKRKLDQLKPYRVGKRKHAELMKNNHEESD
uniref:DRIM domain-containing protein n=1 Tax=Heterorhabditis bacteriophora TaxID=37862 RepID=A0A1I7XJR4_HETBA